MFQPSLRDERAMVQPQRRTGRRTKSWDRADFAKMDKECDFLFWGFNTPDPLQARHAWFLPTFPILAQFGGCCLFMLFLLSLALSLAALAAPPAARGQAIEFHRHHIPMGNGEYKTYLEQAETGADGVLEACGAMAGVEPLGGVGSVITRYPGLRVGDIAPVFGRLCRVDHIEVVDVPRPEEEKGKPPGEGQLIHLDWMRVCPVDRKGLPPGLDFREGDLAVPLERPGKAWFHGGGGDVAFHLGLVTVALAKAESAAVGDPRGPAAEVKVRTMGPVFRTRDGSHVPPKVTNARVRRGDVLTIDGRAYQVRNIVPRDTKQHVIGWIELDPGGSSGEAGNSG